MYPEIMNTLQGDNGGFHHGSQKNTFYLSKFTGNHFCRSHFTQNVKTNVINNKVCFSPVTSSLVISFVSSKIACKIIGKK